MALPCSTSTDPGLAPARTLESAADGSEMEDDELLAQVRHLQAQGLSTDAIARAVGIPRGRIAPLV